MTNMFKFWKFSLGVTSKTKNFAFEVKDIIGSEDTFSNGKGAKIGLNDLMSNRFKFSKYFYGLIIKTNNFSFDSKVKFNQFLCK